jgi:hypothetical protein
MLELMRIFNNRLQAFQRLTHAYAQRFICEAASDAACLLPKAVLANGAEL